MLSGVDDKLEGNLDLVGNVLAADLILTQAKGTALTSARRALAPADGANAISVMLARRVAKSTALLLILVAGQGSARCAAVRALGAGDADVGHTVGAVRGADAAANIMEVLVARGVPEGAPLFAALALVDLTGTSAVGVRLVAVGTIVTEASVVGAVLPADGADT